MRAAYEQECVLAESARRSESRKAASSVAAWISAAPVDTETLRERQTRLTTLRKKAVLSRADRALCALQTRLRARIRAAEAERTRREEEDRQRRRRQREREETERFERDERQRVKEATEGIAKEATEGIEKVDEEKGSRNAELARSFQSTAEAQMRGVQRLVSVVRAWMRGKRARDQMRRVRKLAWRKKLRVPDETRLRNLFRWIDQSGDGNISTQEWLRASMQGFRPPSGDNPWDWYQPTDAIPDAKEGEEDVFPPAVQALLEEKQAIEDMVARARQRGSGLAVRLSLSPDKHMQVFRSIDVDDNGELDEEEFVSFFLSTQDAIMLDWMQQTLILQLEPTVWASRQDYARRKHLTTREKEREEADAKQRAQNEAWARAFFARADQDGTGCIKVPQFLSTLAAGDPGLTLSSVRDEGVRLFRLLDTDKSGSLELDEFVDVLRRGMPDDLYDWMQRSM
jgi:Ca2+-binding EF-hand superfamily protein